MEKFCNFITNPDWWSVVATFVAATVAAVITYRLGKRQSKLQEQQLKLQEQQNSIQEYQNKLQEQQIRLQEYELYKRMYFQIDNIETFAKIFFYKIVIIFSDMIELYGNRKQVRGVVHLELNGKHYYYGNLKALGDSWEKEELGVAYNYLKNYGIDENNPYIGKKCIIRKGTIVTSPHKQ